MFSPLKCALSSLIVVFTGGLFLILLTWRSDIKLNCLYRKVPLPLAKKILLKVNHILGFNGYWLSHVLLLFRTSFTRFSKKMWCRKTFTSKGTDSRKGRTLGISSIRKSNMCGTRIKAWVKLFLFRIMHAFMEFFAFRITVSCGTWMSICWQVTFTKETRDLQTTKFKIASKNLEPISSKSASHPFCICYFTRYNFLFPA